MAIRQNDKMLTENVVKKKHSHDCRVLFLHLIYFSKFRETYCSYFVVR